MNTSIWFSAEQVNWYWSLKASIILWFCKVNMQQCIWIGYYCQRKYWISKIIHNRILNVWFILKCSTVSDYRVSSCLKSNCVKLSGFAALLLPEGSCPSADNVAALLLLAKEACVGARRRLITLLSRGLSWERRAEWWEQIKKDPTWNHIMKKTSSTKQRKIVSIVANHNSFGGKILKSRRGKSKRTAQEG